MSLYVPEILQYTWANKPATAPLGQVICITDIGENGALFRGNGTKWVRTSSLNYANITTPSSMTGTTTETEVGRITVKGGTLGEKGRLNFTTLGSATANANTKTLRVKIGATTIASIVSSGASLFAFNFWFANLNSESSQRTNTGTLFSIDTSVNFDIVFTAQLTNTADNLGIVFVAGDMQ